jgi:GNAT superfamily N-acetyltransferase
MSTEQDNLTIRAAQAVDLDEVVAIEVDATAWLRSRGIEPGQPPRPLRAIVVERIARGQMYLALVGAHPAGNLALTVADDLWDDLPGDALYVHGLMVRRAFAGRQIGLALLRWAAAQAAEQGKPLVRLDCNADNPALRAYYERAGFLPRGEVTLSHRVAARYELTSEDTEA